MIHTRHPTHMCLVGTAKRTVHSTLRTASGKPYTHFRSCMSCNERRMADRRGRSHRCRQGKSVCTLLGTRKRATHIACSWCHCRITNNWCCTPHTCPSRHRDKCLLGKANSSAHCIPRKAIGTWCSWCRSRTSSSESRMARKWHRLDMCQQDNWTSIDRHRGSSRADKWCSWSHPRRLRMGRDMECTLFH